MAVFPLSVALLVQDLRARGQSLESMRMRRSTGKSSGISGASSAFSSSDPSRVAIALRTGLLNHVAVQKNESKDTGDEDALIGFLCLEICDTGIAPMSDSSVLVPKCPICWEHPRPESSASPEKQQLVTQGGLYPVHQARCPGDAAMEIVPKPEA